MKKFPIEFDVYKGSLIHVIIGNKKELEKEYKRLYPKSTIFDVERDYGSFTVSGGENDPHMFMLKGFSLNTAVHEAVHAASKTMKNIGYDHDYSNEEPYAYMVAYIVSELNKNK
jgi:hypothetical protein